MKRIIILFGLFLAWYECFSTNVDVSVSGHTSIGEYNGTPVFVVFSNETLNLNISGKWWSINNNSIDGVQVKGEVFQSYNTSQLLPEQLHLFKLSKYTIGLNTTYNYSGKCYLIINSTSQSTCSASAKTITIWHGNISRWEKSMDGGTTWTNIACTSYQYTESNPSAGLVKYRTLGTNGTYSDIVTITYVDAVPSTIQALPATTTKTVDDSITITADVVDNGYSYQWKKDGTNISGATSRTYTIAPIKSSHAGNYTCDVS